MENKNVGYLILGISLIFIIIIFLFNSALKDIIHYSCGEPHAEVCPMNRTVDQQTYLSLGIVGLLIIVGLFLILSKQKEKLIIKKIRDKKQENKVDTSSLRPDEKLALSLVREHKAIFQADLIEKTGFGKAKITRIIDRLEGMGLVERKRRGMTNVVVLNDSVKQQT